jgi:hypothetical protein
MPPSHRSRPDRRTARVSGYTFALPGEPDLDWTIYTQPGKGVVERIGVTDRKVGVKVTSGFCGTEPIQKGHPLYHAPIYLDDGPRFEERNYIVTKETFGSLRPSICALPVRTLRFAGGWIIIPGSHSISH